MAGPIKAIDAYRLILEFAMTSLMRTADSLNVANHRLEKGGTTRNEQLVLVEVRNALDQLRFAQRVLSSLHPNGCGELDVDQTVVSDHLSLPYLQRVLDDVER